MTCNRCYEPLRPTRPSSRPSAVATPTCTPTRSTARRCAPSAGAPARSRRSGSCGRSTRTRTSERLSDLGRDQPRSVDHVLVREAQHEIAGEQERVRRRPVLLERDARRVGLPAVDLDDDALVVPDEVDARLDSELGRGRRHAVTTADPQEAILELGLRQGRVAEVRLQARRGPAVSTSRTRPRRTACGIAPPDGAVEQFVVEVCARSASVLATLVTGMRLRTCGRRDATLRDERGSRVAKVACGDRG